MVNTLGPKLEKGNPIMFSKLFAIVAALVVMSLSMSELCIANDSSAELATGGLILTKSHDIEMVSEDLFISMKEIRVWYRFYNHSERDVVTQVAFPVPDIDYGVDDFTFVIPTDDPENILNFRTTVNGRAVVALVERKAIINGIDRTKLIQSLGLAIAPRLNQKPNLSQETWDRLVRLGLIQDTRNQEPTYLAPRWTLKTTYYWSQTFPAHQELVVEHRYLPSVGGSVSLSASNLKHSEGINRYCVDQDFWNSAADRKWQPNYLEYILVTGANWAGPIKNFRLVIDKGSPNNLVSFCGSNVRKISSTQFEVTMANFTPKSNLNVLILAPDRRGD
jgi:hypothetical protein